MTDLTDDPLGRKCLTAREHIRRHIAELRRQAARWQPSPCPELPYTESYKSTSAR